MGPYLQYGQTNFYELTKNHKIRVFNEFSETESRECSNYAQKRRRGRNSARRPRLRFAFVVVRVVCPSAMVSCVYFFRSANSSGSTPCSLTIIWAASNEYWWPFHESHVMPEYFFLPARCDVFPYRYFPFRFALLQFLYHQPPFTVSK